MQRSSNETFIKNDSHIIKLLQCDLNANFQVTKNKEKYLASIEEILGLLDSSLTPENLDNTLNKLPHSYYLKDVIMRKDKLSSTNQFTQEECREIARRVMEEWVYRIKKPLRLKKGALQEKQELEISPPENKSADNTTQLPSEDHNKSFFFGPLINALKNEESTVDKSPDAHANKR